MRLLDTETGLILHALTRHSTRSHWNGAEERAAIYIEMMLKVTSDVLLLT